MRQFFEKNYHGQWAREGIGIGKCVPEALKGALATLAGSQLLLLNAEAAVGTIVILVQRVALAAAAARRVGGGSGPE